MRSASALVLIFYFSSSWAAQLREEFTSRARLDSSSDTAIWNQALGKVHPTLENQRTGPSTNIDVGDGSHGSFEPSTYALFDSDGNPNDMHIGLDNSAASEFAELKVTRFYLAQGWTLEPTGDRELVIRSLSDVIIHGTILCSGDDGQDATGTTPGSGGQGRCGGTDGGSGGAQGANGSPGGDVTGAVTGGAGGISGGGGGGGGSWNTSGGTSGANNGGTGGTAGNEFSEPDFQTVLAGGEGGGAGGGGGAGNGSSRGGGGGGGGGIVLIYAVRNLDLGESPTSNYGWILANGGDGGGSDNTGGRGGSGGGGSVLAHVGGTITIYNTDADGASQADGGPGSGGFGIGATGRSWFSYVNFVAPIGYYTPPEEFTFDPGSTAFINTPQSVTSTIIDLGNTAPLEFAFSNSPVSGDFAFEFAGSSDGFVSDDTGWQTSIGLLSGKRYVKFRATITTSTPLNPTMLDFLQLNFTPNTVEEFDLIAAGCGRIEGTGPLNLLLLLLPFLLLCLLKFRAQGQKALTTGRMTV